MDIDVVIPIDDDWIVFEEWAAYIELLEQEREQIVESTGWGD